MVSLARQLTSDLTFGVAIGGAVAISAAFVIGIHVFGKRGLSRDDPLVVKTRLAGALVGTMGGVALFHRLIDYRDELYRTSFYFPFLFFLLSNSYHNFSFSFASQFVF